MKILLASAAATLVLATMLTAAALATADSAADRCGSIKLKASARYAQKALLCRSAAARQGTALATTCDDPALDKLSEAFGAAEAQGGCATSADAAATQARLDANADDAASALAPGSDAGSRRCAAFKLKGVGRYFAATLTCYGNAARQSRGPDPTCESKTAARLDSAFAKAEQRGGCATVGDADTLYAAALADVRDTVVALSPVCGDDLVGPGQVCELADDGACPDLCTGRCECAPLPTCGDGVAVLPEECDDGNTQSADGCSTSCQAETPAALCTGLPIGSGSALDLELVTDRVSAPIYATSPPGDASRLFVVDKRGRIRIVQLAHDALRLVPFLDITELVTKDGERGLLSMAFDPAYATNGRFYVNYTDVHGDTTIARYEVDPTDANLADKGSGRTLLVIAQPFSNHNGGQIAFGPDGYLYVGMGDGGGAGDGMNNAQNDASLLGKMLRLDVSVDGPPYFAVPPSNPHYTDGSDPLELIWAKGLRNPWRFGFDRATGDLLIGDVGQNYREEIDFQSAASTGGENYGWRVFEGTNCYDPSPDADCPSPPAGFAMPILEYPHGQGCAVTGGFVYRGCSMPDLRGTYFYSDVCNGWVHTFELAGGAAINLQDRTADLKSNGATLLSPVSYGQDARGELYVLDLADKVYRIAHE